MKNAQKHADELKSLHKRLAKDLKPAAREAQEPLKAFVRGAMSYDIADSKAEEAMRHIDREFVDLNELRVATDLEIAELLGNRYPLIEKRVAMITLGLNFIFEKEHTLSLDRLKTVSKRDARQFIHNMPEMHPFVEAYVMMYALDGHSFPVDTEILNLLREHGVVDEGTTAEDAQKFVEHHFKAEECYDLFLAVRHSLADDSGKGGKKKK